MTGILSRLTFAFFLEWVFFKKVDKVFAVLCVVIELVSGFNCTSLIFSLLNNCSLSRSSPISSVLLGEGLLNIYLKALSWRASRLFCRDLTQRLSTFGLIRLRSKVGVWTRCDLNWESSFSKLGSVKFSASSECIDLMSVSSTLNCDGKASSLQNLD